MAKYILVIDEGTTGVRAAVVDKNSRIVADSYTEFTQYRPQAGYVEHDAEEIWARTMDMVKAALARGRLSPADIAAIGITTQRATTVVWDKKTGEPISRAIVWQDTRMADFAEKVAPEWAEKTYARVGWPLSPVYSSLSIKWMLDNVPGAGLRAERGDLLFGNMDAWLIYKLTGGRVHATGYSTVTIAGCYDMVNLCWYKEWLDFLGIPVTMLPEVRDDSGDFGVTDPRVFGAEVPIKAAIGDQQASLFGHGCFEPGMVKCTHGTGTFLGMNVGSKPVMPTSGLLAVIGWKIGPEITYAIEGYSAVTGSLIQWLRDGMKIIGGAGETAALAESVEGNDGVYFVPALAGLTAPYWDPYARGLIIGLTLGTRQEHIVRAALEGIAYCTRDLVEAMRDESGVDIKYTKVDGGAARNDFLMQFQADITNCACERMSNVEATSLGAAYLAGLAVGYWKSKEECVAAREQGKVFEPRMEEAERRRLYAGWKEAVARCMKWSQAVS